MRQKKAENARQKKESRAPKSVDQKSHWQKKKERNFARLIFAGSFLFLFRENIIGVASAKYLIFDITKLSQMYFEGQIVI